MVQEDKVGSCGRYKVEEKKRFVVDVLEGLMLMRMRIYEARADLLRHNSQALHTFA